MNAPVFIVMCPVMLLLVIGGLISECGAAPAERVDVHVNKVVGAVTYGGSGFLEGAFSMEKPGDELFLPLKVQRVRGREKYLMTVYKKCRLKTVCLMSHSTIWGRLMRTRSP